MVALSGAFTLGMVPPVFAADRGAIELCGNEIDDDGDGAIDETGQGGCKLGNGSPTSGDGVVPELWTDNPGCQDLGYGFGFKIEGSSGAEYTGTFAFTSADGILTGGAPADTVNSVTITSDGTSLDWTSSIGIDAVFMKGGNGGNAYIYDPEDTADTGLATPGTGPALSHVELCYDYELDASKTATGTFDRDVEWDIAKDVDPATHHLFAGGSGSSDYTVTATKTVVEDNYQVNGAITVGNPTPFDLDFEVEDSINGISATVGCPSTAVTAGSSIECTYAANEADGIDGAQTLNTATVTSSSPSVDGAVATAAIAFAANPTGEAESISVTDDHDDDAFDQGFGPVSETTEWTYSATFDCSSTPGDYTGGTYSFTEDNTATIDETGDKDSETVTVNCYAPVVIKDAATEWQREYTWTIGKLVDPNAHTGFAGDSFTSGYTVSVDQTMADYGFKVSGTISVGNPAGSPGSMTVALSDSVDGMAATLDCGGSVTVAPGEQETCGYTLDLPDNTGRTNTATGTFNGIDFVGTAAVTFGDPIIVGYPSIQVTDTQTHSPAPWSASGDAQWTYTGQFLCPTDTALYEDGVHTYSVPNRARITETGQLADQSVDVTCYLPASAKVVKTTTEGGEDIGQLPLKFALYAPGLVPASSEPTETRTLDGAGDVAFDTDLKVAGTWTVVELLPDGWVSTTDTACAFDVAFPGSAGETYPCSFDNVEKSRVDLLKLTNGVETMTQTWSFALYEGLDGFGGTQVASDGTPPALVDFGLTDLNPLAAYTLCEREVPAGYSSLWQLDTDGDGAGDTTVLPYNPNAADDPPEDLGNRCVDIGADTSIALASGTTLHVVVDNQSPGGAPRTPGYWKNWNRCTGGGQQYTADANGGWEQGFWLLEDVLDPSIGGGILWDDIGADGFVFPIGSCEIAVDILDKREVDDPALVGDGKKKASDPLINLATHLLAAQLNFGAGACTTDDVNQAALDAEALLDRHDFDGTAGLLPKKSADADLANRLATYLDAYNNGAFCGDGIE